MEYVQLSVNAPRKANAAFSTLHFFYLRFLFYTYTFPIKLTVLRALFSHLTSPFPILPTAPLNFSPLSLGFQLLKVVTGKATTEKWSWKLEKKKHVESGERR